MSKDRPLTDVQERALIQMESKRPAWVIRVGRVTTLEALERQGFAEVRLGHYGWEGRITDAGIALLNTMGD
jgi:hypothetical protein